MQVFEKSSPSVVSIINYKVERLISMSSTPRITSPPTPPRQTEGGVSVPEGIGTGVVWDSFGHVATNYHVLSKIDKSLIPQAGRVERDMRKWIVVDGRGWGPLRSRRQQATKVLATDAGSGRTVTYSVELAGADAMLDLAVLRITSGAAGHSLPRGTAAAEWDSVLLSSAGSVTDHLPFSSAADEQQGSSAEALRPITMGSSADLKVRRGAQRRIE